MSSPHLHPEFGCFCPSPKLRHRLWAVGALLAFGSIAGANALLSLAGDERVAEVMPAVARSDDKPVAAAVNDGKPVAATTLIAKTASAPATLGTPDGAQPDVPQSEANKPAASRANSLKPACEETTWSHLDGRCIAGNERKPRTVQVPANRPAVAAVAPARSVPPPARPAASAAATAGAPDNRAGGPVRMLPTVSSGAAPGPVMAERPPGPFGRPQTLAQIRPEGWRAPVVVNHPQGPFGFLFSFFR